MRICKIEGWNMKHMAKGYCVNHYHNFHKTGNPLGKFNGDRESRFKALRKITIKFTDCQIVGCNNKHYAKHYCMKHYAALVERSGYKLHKCSVVSCNYKTHNLKYCNFHSKRNSKHRSLDLTKKYTLRGNKNPRWNGGVSEYPNHYLMKKNRLIKLQQTKCKCETCGRRANLIHHKDGSVDNHSIDNLIVLCHVCHSIIHMRRGNTNGHTTKFIRKYGMTLKEMGQKFGKSWSKYYYMHKKGTLSNWLDTNSKE